jgi:hypothetical protein
VTAAIVLAALTWYATGVAGFAYWWPYHLTAGELPAALYAGTIGPLAWALGYLIHGRR